MAPDGATAADIEAQSQFVGRRTEMRLLEAAVAESLSGRGAIVLLTGEPGIGKTRCLEELAETAHRLGARVLAGRCHDRDGAPAYWPWVQILRAYAEGVGAGQLRSEMGRGATDVGRLIPELTDLASDPTARSDDALHARFRLFDSVTRFLDNAARSQPLLVVLDDLQCADASSLLLLQFLARNGAGARLALVVTCRDTDLGLDAVEETLAEIARAPHSRRIRLRGLLVDEVERLIECISGETPSSALASRLHQETGGNPLFVIEIVRLLADEARLTADAALVVPPRVQDVLHRRLRRLSPACAHVLTAASALGREFAAPILARVVEDGRAHVLDLLAEAARAELIIEVPSVPWCFRFSHALVREVLYRGLDAQTRPALHGRIGEVLEAWHGPQVDLHLAQLAHHFYEAAGAGHGEQAIDYATRAARRAVAGVAYDEAAAHYDRALRVLEIVAPEDAGRRARLLLARGGCRLRAGDGAGARASFEQVADIARVTRDPELLARAALGCGARSDPLAVNVHLIALLEEALRALGDRPSALRALVTARLARELGRGDRGVTLAQNAVATAMQLDDRRVLTSVLIEKRFALWGPDNLAERLSEATLILQAAEAAGESEAALAARLYRVIDLLELGQIADVDRELELLYRTAEDLRQPWYLEHAAALRSMRARLEGRYDDAERLAREALEIGLRIGDPSARTTYAGHALELARERGGLEGLEPELRRYAADYPTLGLVRYVPPWLHAELGHEAESRRELDRLAVQDFTDVPRDMNWLGALALLAEACAFLGDASRAAILYERLRPYAPRIVVGGFGAICFGSLSLFLGKLAAAASRWEEAIRHFEDALAENGRLGARPLVARTQLAYGFMLLDREAPGDTERGRALLAEASVMAERLGMTRLAGKAGTPNRPVGALAPSADDAPGGEMVFSREGEFWTIAYRGTVVRLRDTRGLRYLARLLGNPGRELLAVDVVSDDRGGGESLAGMSRGGGATVARHPGDAGDVLDGRAVAAYRTRLAEVQDLLAEARRFNDVGRAARLEAELHALAGQLAQGVGLRGRRRKAGSYAERARLNVYKGIKAVLGKIAKANPALGHHLATTVRTGTLCSYRPDPRVPAAWNIRGTS